MDQKEWCDIRQSYKTYSPVMFLNKEKWNLIIYFVFWGLFAQINLSKLEDFVALD